MTASQLINVKGVAVKGVSFHPLEEKEENEEKSHDKRKANRYLQIQVEVGM